MPLERSNLRRSQVRSYLMALLCSDQVPQSSDCELGYLWTNCDGEMAPITDHSNHQIGEDIEGSLVDQPKNAALSFKFDRVRYAALPARLDKTTIDLQIDIIAFGKDGEFRTDICDIIEERVIYRLLSQQEFISQAQGNQNGQTLVSFMRWIDENGFNIESRDDQSFDGNYTIRELSFSLTFSEKIHRPDCEIEPICFDFSSLTRLDKD